MKNLKYLNILYIEDDKEVLKNISSTMSNFVKKVYSAENAEDALEIYKTKKIDIIFTDIDLPELSGLAFTKVIRKDNLLIPIVVITAYKTEAFLLDAVTLNLQEYIVKPISYDELKKSLKKCVEKLERLNLLKINFENGASYNITNKIFMDYANIPQHLQPKELLLLKLLIENQNSITFYDEIERELWAVGSINKGTLKALIRKLRQKIGHDTIVTESELGYRFVI